MLIAQLAVGRLTTWQLETCRLLTKLEVERRSALLKWTLEYIANYAKICPEYRQDVDVTDAGSRRKGYHVLLDI